MNHVWSRIALVAAVSVGIPATAHATTIYFNTSSPLLNTWTSQNVPLSGPGWVVDDWNGGVVATEAQIQFVLANLQAMYILTEWKTGVDDTNVDNVRLGTGASDDFSLGTAGWVTAGPTPESDIADQSVPTSTLDWDANFGNPAGSVREQDVFFWTWIAAPAAYLGNQSPRYGETLSLDILIRQTDGVAYPLVALVAPDQAAAPVPEPATLILLGSGLLGLARARMSRHRT